MPGFPLPGRPAGEPDELLLDTILDGQSLPPDAPPDAHALGQTLADLAGPAEPGALPGEVAARSRFARVNSPAGVWPAARPARHKQSRLSVPRSARIVAVLAAAAVGVGGTAAAYSGALPGPIQDFAHHVVGAPPAHPASHPRPHHGKDKPAKTRMAKHKAHPPPQPLKPLKPIKPPKPPKPPRLPKPPKPAPPPPKPPMQWAS
jgi:hypothetical protein